MNAMQNEYKVDVRAPSANTSSARTYVAAVAMAAGLVGATTYSIPLAAQASTAESSHNVTDAEARAELKRITPPNAELLKLADRFPAPQEWYDE